MTLKQFAAMRFYKALDIYRQALLSRQPELIVTASLAVYLARRNEQDRRLINRTFRENGKNGGKV